MDNDLYVRSVRLNRDRVPSFEEYPFCIEAIRNLDTVEFTSPVTFLVGENGIGKSTFIEALAICLGMNAEGGSQNFDFSSRDTTSSLHDYLTVSRLGRPVTRYFLRAETFYNISSEIENLEVEKAYGGSLHTRSHGEAFLQLVQQRFYDGGLFLLDEPESALSPVRQMTLLCEINRLAAAGSQFIIATHSPILISYRDGVILDMNNGFKKISYRDTEVYKMYRLYLDNPELMQHQLFD